METLPVTGRLVPVLLPAGPVTREIATASMDKLRVSVITPTTLDDDAVDEVAGYTSSLANMEAAIWTDRPPDRATAGLTCMDDSDLHVVATTVLAPTLAPRDHDQALLLPKPTPTRVILTAPLPSTILVLLAVSGRESSCTSQEVEMSGSTVVVPNAPPPTLTTM